jgi:hypothetical protein
MNELVPIILGFLCGVAAWPLAPGRWRLVLSAFAVIASGAAATVISGEFAESWRYLLLDVGEAALGLASGLVATHLLPRRQTRATGRGGP